jgi:CheY-like chemotaxis protein
MEPWLYGTSTGVSTVGIIASAVFWTWLWGPLGLVLSMPLTVCLTVLGRHVPRLDFLDVLLSDQPALELKVRFYQRLLALDFEEACDLVTEATRRASLDEVFDQVLLPALSLAERDRHEGHLGAEPLAFVHRSIGDLIGSAEHQLDTSAASNTVPRGAASGAAGGAAPSEAAGPPAADLAAPVPALVVLCLPAEDEADRLASTMLATLLTARGHQVRVAAKGGAEASADLSAGAKPDCAVVSAVAPGGAIAARELTRRLRGARPDLPILVGLWHARGSLEGARSRLANAGVAAVSTTLADAVAFVTERARAGPQPQRAGSGAPPVLAGR